LGGGDFVDGLKQECSLRKKMKSVITLARLVETVAQALSLEADTVRRPSKNRAPATARGIICHLAIYEYGYNGKEVDQYLHLGPTGVSLAAKRGEKVLRADQVLLQGLTATLDK